MSISRPLLALVLGTSRLAAQSTWCDYRPDSIPGVISANTHGLNDSLGPDQRAYIIASDRPALLLSLVYTGERDTLSAESSRFLDAFFLTAAHDTTTRRLFQEAGRFREGHTSYWLPVQDTLFFGLQQEVVPGDSVILFARWLGAWQLGHATEWVFVVNEFSTAASAAAWAQALKNCPPRR